MRQVAGWMLFAGLVLSSSAAFAQDEPKTKFYNFDDMLIDGALKAPDVTVIDPNAKAKFDRLLDLKKSFLPKIRESAGERALQ